MEKTIVLVGATGTLGKQIAAALSQHTGVRLRCLVRAESRAKAGPLAARGAQVLEGNLDADHEEVLHTLCQGAYTVISAVQGGPEVLIDGQRRLLQAARAAGVRRFIPSDYAFDFFALEEGENPHSDWRRAFAQIAEEERGSLEVVHLLNGCFLDRRVLFGFLGAFNLERGEAYLWGDGHKQMDFTTYHDVARYAAALALDTGVLPERFQVAGDVLNFHELVEAYEDASGNPLTVRRLGSFYDLDLHLAALQERAPDDLMTVLPFMYYRAMLSGKAKLDTLHNDHYPHIRPTTVREYVTREGL